MTLKQVNGLVSLMDWTTTVSSSKQFYLSSLSSSRVQARPLNSNNGVDICIEFLIYIVPQVTDACSFTMSPLESLSPPLQERPPLSAHLLIRIFHTCYPIALAGNVHPAGYFPVSRAIPVPNVSIS